MDEQCLRQRCDERFEGLESHRDTMINPEHGVLAKIFGKLDEFSERLGNKVSLSIVVIIVLALLGSIGGSYAYTNRVETKMYESVATSEDLDRFKKDMKERMDTFERNVLKKLDELNGGGHGRREVTR